MRILHLIPSLEPGGAPLGALELASCQFSCGMETEILVIGRRSETFNVDSIPVPVRFLDLNWRFGDRGARQNVIRQIRHFLEQRRPDVLHSHLLPADYVGAIAAARISAHVSHVRDTQPWLQQRGMQQIMKRWLYRRAFSEARTSFVAVSRSAGEYCRKAFRIPSERMHVVLNGIDGRRFPDMPVGPRGTDFVIGCAGRMSAEKGHSDLILAFSRLLRQHPNCRLLIAGSGGLENELRTLVDSLAVSPNVQFSGLVTDMNAWYRSLDVLVVPSRSSEGLARAIMESMYCGVPVVSTRVAGSDEAIRHGTDGYLVEMKNPDAIAAAVIKLVTSEDVRRTLSANALQRARSEFTVDRVQREVNTVYQSILNTVNTVKS